jgi:hypothetical protein
LNAWTRRGTAKNVASACVAGGDDRPAIAWQSKVNGDAAGKKGHFFHAGRDQKKRKKEEKKRKKPAPKAPERRRRRRRGAEGAEA